MKKIIIIATLVTMFTILSLVVINGGNSSQTLYLLNWGEYINQDLLVDFENEYNCQVVEEVVTSSETMYQKITAGTTSYDVAIPGDYMITKLFNEGYLKKIDVNNDELETLKNYEDMFVPKLTNLRQTYMKETIEYSMPYFWGAYSIIYNTSKSDVEDVVKNNGFTALFDRSLYNEKVNIGMYSTARWAVSSYLMSKGENPNIESFDDKDLVSGIKNAKFDVWGDDQLKRKTATGDLDLCFTQLGDFFDALYLALDEGLDVNNGKVGLEGLNFNVNVPSITSAFFDAMVIPTTTQNESLANKFINFMLRDKNAFANAQAIGYCPTLNSVIDLYKNNPDDLYYEDETNPERNVTLKQLCEKYPFYLDPLINSTETFMFEPKDASYMTRCESIVNQSKATVDNKSSLGKVLCFTVLGVSCVSICIYIAYEINKKVSKKRK